MSELTKPGQCAGVCRVLPLRVIRDRVEPPANAAMSAYAVECGSNFTINRGISWFEWDSANDFRTADLAVIPPTYQSIEKVAVAQGISAAPKASLMPARPAVWTALARSNSIIQETALSLRQRDKGERCDHRRLPIIDVTTCFSQFLCQPCRRFRWVEQWPCRHD